MVIAENAGLDWTLKKARRGTPKQKLEHLQSLAITTVHDLLNYLPDTYEDRRSLSSVRDARDGDHGTFEGYIDGVRDDVHQDNRQITNLFDTYGDMMAYREGLSVAWFGRSYLCRLLNRGHHVRVHGTVSTDTSTGRLLISKPEIDALDASNWKQPAVNSGRIVPIYGLGSRMSQTYHRLLVWDFLNHCHQQQPERSRPGESAHTLSQILWTLHFPREMHHPALACAEMAADETLELYVALLHLRGERRKRRDGRPIPVDSRLADDLQQRLPVALTPSQELAIAEIRTDLATAGQPMRRVLQGGDVSDKMVVALHAVLDTAGADLQSLLNSSTSMLAEQYLRAIIGLLGAYPVPTMPDLSQVQLPARLRSVTIACLTSTTKGTQRRRILRSTKAGGVDLIIGTRQALGDHSTFRQPGLIITDALDDFDPRHKHTFSQDDHHLILTTDPISPALQLLSYPDMDFSTADPEPHAATHETAQLADLESYIRGQMDGAKMTDHVDLAMVEREHAIAEEIHSRDPDLQIPEHRALLAGRNRKLERLQRQRSNH